MNAPRQRADRLLVARGLFKSRAKAQAAIEAGLITADERVVSKASEEIPTDALLRASAVHPYVSRGGVKLAAALDRFHLTQMVTMSASMSAPLPVVLRKCC